MSKSLSTQPSRKPAPWFGRDTFASFRDEMNDLLSRFSSDSSSGWLPAERFPSLDLSETDGAIEVKLDLPGVKPEEIDIEVRGDMLYVRGEHKEEKEEKGKTFHRVERRSGTFSRSVTLPCAVDQEKVSAECRDGVLTVKLPKSEESRTKKIKVKS